MTDQAKAQAIVERLEKLTCPDPAVDEAIHVHLSGATAEWQDRLQANAYHKDGFWVSIGPTPPLTSSLDAAVALVEKVLPGWGISVGINIKSFGAGLWMPGDLGPTFRGPSTKPPAIALLLALFRALAQGE